MIKLTLKLESTNCNGWPNLIIEFNNKKILEKIIEKESTLEVELDNVLETNNQLIIGMNNKVLDVKVYGTQKQKITKLLLIKL